MTPFIMRGDLSLPDAITAAGYGIGAEYFLRDLTKCVCKEKANGFFYTELTVPTASPDYEALKSGGLIWIKPNARDNSQCFRISSEEAAPVSGLATFTANHISYDLKKAVVLPFTAASLAATIEAFTRPLVRLGKTEFTITADFLSQRIFRVRTPQPLRAVLAQQFGSMQLIYGGEWRFDNLTATLKQRRGVDSDALIMYGRNITDYRQERNLTETYTAAIGYAMDGDTAVLGDAITIIASNDPSYAAIDVSDRLADGETPTAARVTDLTRRYIAENDLTKPKISISLSFLDLAQTEEYKDAASLETCGLFDSVTVRFPSLGVNAAAKVIEYEYDVLAERYNRLEIGDARKTLVSTVAQLASMRK